MLITRKQVAFLLEISPATVLKRVDAGLLPEPIRDGPGRYRKWEYEDIVKLRDALRFRNTPPASSAEPARSECPPQSENSSDKPEPS